VLLPVVNSTAWNFSKFVPADEKKNTLHCALPCHAGKDILINLRVLIKD
jgi:hypothetical protein